MLYIDPVECMDSGACVPVCPVSAIFALDDLPEKWKHFTERTPSTLGGKIRVPHFELGARLLSGRAPFLLTAKDFSETNP